MATTWPSQLYYTAGGKITKTHTRWVWERRLLRSKEERWEKKRRRRAARIGAMSISMSDGINDGRDGSLCSSRDSDIYFVFSSAESNSNSWLDGFRRLIGMSAPAGSIWSCVWRGPSTSSVLTRAIRDFLGRTDHVVNVWKHLGKDGGSMRFRLPTRVQQSKRFSTHSLSSSRYSSDPSSIRPTLTLSTTVELFSFLVSWSNPCNYFVLLLSVSPFSRQHCLTNEFCRKWWVLSATIRLK